MPNIASLQYNHFDHLVSLFLILANLHWICKAYKIYHLENQAISSIHAEFSD